MPYKHESKFSVREPVCSAEVLVNILWIINKVMESIKRKFTNLTDI